MKKNKFELKEVHLRGIEKKHYDEVNKLRRLRRYTWHDFFEHLYNYKGGLTNFFNRSKDVDLGSLKSIQTVNILLPKWCDNIAHNCHDIIDSGDISTLICKTRKDNKCWKLEKLKEKYNDKEEYDAEDICKDLNINPQSLEMLLRHAMTYDFVTCAGSAICNGCQNYFNANKPALIIAGGPSLKTYNHLDLLKKYGFEGDIFAVSKELKNVLEHGIIPNYVGALDADEFDTSFFNHDIVDKYSNQITAFFGTNVHPTTVQRWKGKRYYFTGYISEAEMPNIAHVFHLITRTSTLSVSGNIGSCLYNIASFLGYNPIITIGLDLSFPTIKDMKAYFPPTTEENWNKTMMVGNKERKQYKRGFNPYFKKQFYYDSVFEAYTLAHKSWSDLMSKGFGLKSINCSEQGSLYGKGIECMRFEDYLKNQKEINKLK